VDPRRPTPPHPAIASLLTALAANLHALERAADARPIAAAPPAIRPLGRSEPPAPAAPPTPAQNPMHLIPLRRRPSTAPRAAASKASSAAVTARPLAPMTQHP